MIYLGMIYKENLMFTLTGNGIRNIFFDARLHNPAQLPAQLTLCPTQSTSKKVHNFHFFPHPVRRPGPSLFESKDFNAANKNIRFKSFRYLYFVTQLDFIAAARTSISSVLSGVVTGQVINLPVQGQQICS